MPGPACTQKYKNANFEFQKDIVNQSYDLKINLYSKHILLKSTNNIFFSLLIQHPFPSSEHQFTSDNTDLSSAQVTSFSHLFVTLDSISMTCSGLQCLAMRRAEERCRVCTTAAWVFSIATCVKDYKKKLGVIFFFI